MSKIIKRIKAFMEVDEWHPEQDRIEGLDRIFTRYVSKEGSWKFVVLVEQEKKVVTFYSVLDTMTPEDRRLDMAQFITRANFGLRIGKFEMDWEEGIVRFQSGVILEDTELTKALIKRHCYNNVNTMTQYFSGIMKVIFGGNTPEEAIQNAEEQEDDMEYVPGKDTATHLYIQ